MAAPKFPFPIELAKKLKLPQPTVSISAMRGKKITVDNGFDLLKDY